MGDHESEVIMKAEKEEIERLEQAPPFWRNRRRLSKQLSMCETPRDIAWERRRRKILLQQEKEKKKKKKGAEEEEDNNNDNNNNNKNNNTIESSLTDDDLNELKGCIELGFGFKEGEGRQRLCSTLPALDLYFAVNRQYSFSPVSTPSGSSTGGRTSALNSPSSDSDSWKICTPGENPENVKTKLRHWAQAVACSVMQSY